WPPPQYSKPTRPTPWLEAYPYAEKRRDTARRTPYLGEILTGKTKDTGLCLRILMISTINSTHTYSTNCELIFEMSKEKSEKVIDEVKSSLAKVSARYPYSPPTVPVSFGFGITLPQRCDISVGLREAAESRGSRRICPNELDERQDDNRPRARGTGPVGSKLSARAERGRKLQCCSKRCNRETKGARAREKNEKRLDWKRLV
ncbi:hypothetical protein K0M31_004947, partial [Melipona bicolor]